MISGLSTTLMAIMCGFGSLMLMGVSYNVINTIIPFLIIAIGIDDMFIMTACWEQSDERQPVPVRMAQTLSHAGVAVTITNITDIMSFAIGCITDLPGIQLFCLYACVSVAFCYFFQITYFCGFMAICGDMEHEKRHCLFFYKTVGSISIAELNKSHKEDSVFPANFRKFQRTKSSNASKNYPESSSDDSFYSERSLSTESGKQHVPATPPPAYQHVVQSDHNKEPSRIVKWLGEKYGPFILTNPVRIVAALLFTAYIVGAYYGCINFREGLNPGNLVTKDHYISQYFEDIKSFWKSGPQLQIAVLNPPDLINSKTRQQLLSTAAAFENTEYTLGREGTVFFLLEYLNYLDQLNVELEDTAKLWHQKLRSWLKYTGGASQWASDIKFNETTDTIAAFRFCVAMKNIVEPNQHKLAAKLMREIADAQPFQIEVFHEAFPFADQYLIILPAMIFNVVISLLCMTVVSFLMVPSLPSGFIIFISIVSINVGVFGYMTLWGVNLDAVSMISIIMSIGFAVDLSGHIIYAFVTSHGDTNQRVIGALEALGWPIFQGASSTIAGITILYTVDAYIILVFFKTIWLTMVIGAIHGLFFIPVFLSIFPVGFFRIPKSSELH
ncbi:patched family protein [Oesophagostomum dentatum]|uniref:Patched family protein n=1 Tax=Oesophagostomum dentatum TaxID=61180 RepID=A0A0B1TC52_OESDE|nr:patched family protein [Oesophagostomum dentatum]